MLAFRYFDFGECPVPDGARHKKRLVVIHHHGKTA